MNIWENAVLTDKGTALQAKLVDGQTLHITKVVSGGAKVPVVNLRQQTNVTDGGKEITLQPVRIEGDKTVLPVLLENTGLEEGYDLWQVGIYAQDPEEDEILYCLAQASEAKHIPSAKEGPGFSVTWDFVIKTSNTAPFEVDVNSVGLVSIEQYQVHAGEIHSLKSANVYLDRKIEDLNKNLFYTPDWITPHITSGRCTIDGGGYFSNGKRVCLQVVIITSVELAGGNCWTILSGLPLGDGNRSVSVSCSLKYSGFAISGHINTYGELCIATPNTIAKGSAIVINADYYSV